MTFGLLSALRHMALVLSLQLLPFAVHAIGAPSRTRRVLAPAVYLVFPGVASYLGARTAVLWLAVGAAYYVVLGLGVNRLRDALTRGLLTRGALFAVASTAYLVVPGVILPGVAGATFLIAGWDIVLSVYSYCIETSRPGQARPPLKDCLFFLLVNPTLFYGARGRPLETPVPAASYLLRVAGGATLMFANSALLRPACEAVRSGAWSSAVPGSVVFLAPAAYGALRFVTLYASHAGLASIQIGMMQQAGWSVPERYVRPWAAASPFDFWRRWNTYVRVWLEAYCFLPVALRIAKRTPRRSGQYAAAVITLAVSGLLHDGYSLVAYPGQGGLRCTELFLAAGVVHVAWRAAGVTLAALRARFPGFRLTLGNAGRIVAHAGMASVLISAAAVWG